MSAVQKAKPKSKKKIDLALVAAQLLRAKDAGKEAYAKADELLQVLLEHSSVGNSVAIPGGQVVTIIDSFAKGNKAWKPCGINRFDVKVSRSADLTTKL